ncbi:hypothetical protein J6590_029301, partial [Homalodisca vitripennis]
MCHLKGGCIEGVARTTSRTNVVVFNSKDILYSYDAFRRQLGIQFLSPDYRRTLDEEIRKMGQETVIAMIIFVRRSGILSEEEKLDIICKNMRLDYKFCLLSYSASILSGGHIIERQKDYEAYLREKNSFRLSPPSNVV